MHGQDQEGEVGNQQEEGAAGQSGQAGAAEAGRTEASGQGGAAQEGSVLQMEDVSVQTVQALEDKGRILISGGAEASAMAGNLTGGRKTDGRGWKQSLSWQPVQRADTQLGQMMPPQWSMQS